jgi:membrane protease YdiL (CAAX protease family)
MQSRQTSSVSIYVIITFSLSILLSIFIGVTGGENTRYAGAKFISMFIPAIAVFILHRRGDSFVRESLQHFPLSWMPVALFIFPVIIHAVCIPVIAFQNNYHIPWQSWLTRDGDGLYHAPGDKGWGVLTNSGLIFHIVLNAIAGILMVSFLAFFEEIGWRAWLLPRLIERFNIRRGVLICSVIWALWHVPFILGGLHFIEQAPMWSVLLFYPLGHVGAGIILGWLWVKTESIWIVSIAHGSLNNWGQYLFKFMDDITARGETIALIAALNLSLFIVGMIVLGKIPTNRNVNPNPDVYS